MSYNFPTGVRLKIYSYLDIGNLLKVSSLSKLERQSIIRSKIVNQKRIMKTDKFNKIVENKEDLQKMEFGFQICTELPKRLQIKYLDDAI